MLLQGHNFVIKEREKFSRRLFFGMTLLHDSKLTKQCPSLLIRYLEYLRKIQEAARQTSPSGISSSTGQAERANGGGGGRNGHAAARSEPPVPGSESHLFSRLYLENMVKSAAAAAAGESFFI